MIADSPLDFIFRELFYRLPAYAGAADVYLKMEGFSVSGSIKVKTAMGLVEDLERRGAARPGRTTIVESSSGNLGIALSIVCGIKGYRFVCVTDPDTTGANVRGMRAYGAEVIVVDRRDENGGYLGTRFARIREILAADPDAVWLDQSANPANKAVHARETAEEILAAFPAPDWLFLATGTTGTFVGCAETMRLRSPRTRIVAVEPEGSVTFEGSKAARRNIPGIGSSRRPGLVRPELADAVLHIDEASTVRTCRDFVRHHHLLIGGSTGSVLAGVRRMSHRFRPGETVVAISPDLGDKYLDSVYDDAWVAERIGPVEPPRDEAAS